MNKPTRTRFTDPNQAFTSRTVREGECLIWVGANNGVGYGEIRVHGEKVYAHRFAWERAHGPIPAGMQIDHICRNRACVEITHMRLATHAQNLRHLAGPDRNNRHSGIRNVYPTGNGKWTVRMRVDGRYPSFGTFSSLDDAAHRAAQVRRDLFGEFAGT